MVKSFGEFEFDDQRRTLTTNGKRVRFSGQAVDLLGLLLEQPGALITREEVRAKLWPDSTVEFDHSLDVVVSRLRSVLGDPSPTPRYIETVPRRGYRFIEPVTSRREVQQLPPRRYRLDGFRRYAAIAILAALVAILLVRTRYDKVVSHHRSSGSPAQTAR